MGIKNRYIFFSAVFLLCLIESSLNAQSTYNPYSMYGIGELEMGEYGYNAGMGGISTGVRSSGFLNVSNPASITAIDTNTFIYDFALASKFSDFQSGSTVQSAVNANFKKLSMGFLATHRWGLSFGLAPFSNVGYKIKSTQLMEGTENTYVNGNYSGSGGINKLFLSNSFLLTKKLSVGINSSLLFGNIHNVQELEGWTSEKISYARNLYFDFGLQYADSLSKDVSFVIGAVYGNKTSVTLRNNLIVSQDTVVSNGSLGNETQYIPMFYGIGFSANLHNAVTVGVDYYFQHWSDINSGFPGVTFVDMHKVKLGIQYVPRVSIYRHYYQRVHYQAGVSIYNSYIKINGNVPLNYGVNIGLGLPVKKTGLINLGFEFGQLGSARLGQIKETYGQVSVGVSISDIWFLKRRFD